MYYHKSKQSAIDAGQYLTNDWNVRAELEPFNGWVMVLSPKRQSVLQEPFWHLLEIAEICVPRLRQRPDTYRAPPKHAHKPNRGKVAVPAAPPPPPPTAAPQPTVATPVAPPPPPVR